MRLVASLAVVTFCAGCTQVTVAAPYKHEVRLLSAGETASVHRQYRAWYGLWGLFRISGKDPADVIRDEVLCEARVRVEDNVPDAFIGVTYTLLQPIGIVPQTIIVEGNRNVGCE